MALFLLILDLQRLYFYLDLLVARSKPDTWLSRKKTKVNYVTCQKKVHTVCVASIFLSDCMIACAPSGRSLLELNPSVHCRNGRPDVVHHTAHGQDRGSLTEERKSYFEKLAKMGIEGF